jgi:hypothetical protein
VRSGLLSCLSRTLCWPPFVGVVEAGGVLVGEEAPDEEVVLEEVVEVRR